MRKWIVFTLLAAALALAFPVAAQDVVPRFEEDDCPFTIPSGEDPRCGYLVVPENRADPNSGTIRLAVAIFKADNPNPQPDPVIYLEGGPGGSTLKTIQIGFGSTLAPFNADRDVIAFDQRGVGLSQPALDCPETAELAYDTLDEHLSVDEDVNMFADAVRACGARLTGEGVNLQAYNTAESAADVNDLRQVLGYDQLNLFGISYGTRLALTIMRDFPQAVRSAIIDSVVPLQASGFGPANTAQRALSELFSACENDAACAEMYPNLEAVFYETVDELNTAPVTITIPNLRTGGSIDALVTGDDFVGLVFQAMYIDTMIQDLPDYIYTAAKGDVSPFSTVLLLQLYQLDFISYGMYYAVNCNEEYPFDTVETIQSTLDSVPEGLVGFARLGMIDPEQLQVCRDLGTRTPDVIENQPVISDIPTLVMSGQFDPITPPDYGQQAAATLSSSFFYEFPGLTHGVVPADRCPTQMALAFLDDPTTAPDASCIASLPAPEFVIGSLGASSAPLEVALIPFEDTTFGIRGLKPQGWQDVTLGTVARGEGAGDQTALVQLAVPFTTPEQVWELLKGQLGLEATPPITETRQANGLTWQLYRLDMLGLPSDLALAAGDGITYMVQMTSNRNERDALYEAVFLPVVDAFTPIG